MREGSTVPESVIPERAWGMVACAVAREQMLETDPFGGKGVRLEVPPGIGVSIEDIQKATHLTHVVLWADAGIAWVAHEPGRSRIESLWEDWLARRAI